MKKSLSICAVFVVLQLLIGICASVIAMTITGISSPTLITQSPVYINSIGISLIVINLIMILWVGYLCTKSPVGAFTHRIKKAPAAVWIWGIITLYFFTFTVDGLLEIFDIPDFLSQAMDGMMNTPICIVAITLIGPIGEEVVFRRGIIENLQESPRFARYAVVISALLFGIIHFNPTQTIAAFLLGLFLGWAYLASGKNLLIPIVFHILNNTTSTVLSHYFGYDFKFLDFAPNTFMYFGVLAVMAVLAYVCFRRLRKVFRNQPSQNEQTEESF